MATVNHRGDEHSDKSPLISGWSDLPYDCLVNIFTRLNQEDRWQNTMFVCKSWHKVSKDPHLNSVFDLESCWPQSESSSFCTPQFEKRIDLMIQSVVNWSNGSVTEIRVRYCTDRAISIVGERCPNLKVLSIKSSPNVTDESMVKLASGCPKLQELDISYCYKISHKSLAILGGECKSILILKRNQMNWINPLKHIGFIPSSQDADLEASTIAKFMSQLLHLELRFSKLSAKGLYMISKGCQDLEYLDLSACVNMASHDIERFTSKLANLKTLQKQPYIRRPMDIRLRYKRFYNGDSWWDSDS